MTEDHVTEDFDTRLSLRMSAEEEGYVTEDCVTGDFGAKNQCWRGGLCDRRL